MSNKILFKFNRNKQRGSFLLELMIGMLLSLVSVLGVLTIYANFEGQKKTTTQVGQSISNAALALFPLQGYGRMAGYGFNDAALMGCKVNAYNANNDATFDFTMVPVVIEAGATNKDSDTIKFLLGESDGYFAPSKLTQPMPSPSAVYNVDNRFGMREGDLLIAAEPGKDCTLSQISNLPSQQNQTDNVIKNAGNYTDPTTGQSVPTVYNKSGGLGIAYNTDARLYNIGASPKLYRFYVDANNQMIQENDLAATIDKKIIGDNILMLKAVYGLDLDNNGAVDTWTNITPVNQADLAKIIGVRVALLARSSLREKKSDDGACNVTLNPTFSWLNGTFDVSNIPDWGCYRYRVVQTTIPLKNMLWRSQI